MVSLVKPFSQRSGRRTPLLQKRLQWKNFCKTKTKAPWMVSLAKPFFFQRKAGGYMKIQIKKLKENAVIPTRGSAYAAGYDLYACIDEAIEIGAGETVKVGTGLSVAVPEGYFGAVFARSGLAAKEGLRPANCVGVCDADYRGEYIVALHNDSSVTRTVTPGERIAQLVIMPFLSVEFEEADALTETARGAGGFGSTGI